MNTFSVWAAPLVVERHTVCLACFHSISLVFYCDLYAFYGLGIGAGLVVRCIFEFHVFQACTHDELRRKCSSCWCVGNMTAAYGICSHLVCRCITFVDELFQTQAKCAPAYQSIITLVCMRSIGKSGHWGMYAGLVYRYTSTLVDG